MLPLVFFVKLYCISYIANYVYEGDAPVVYNARFEQRALEKNPMRSRHPAQAVCTAGMCCQEVRLVLDPLPLVGFPVLQTLVVMDVILLQDLPLAQTPSTLYSPVLL